MMWLLTKLEKDYCEATVSGENEGRGTRLWGHIEAEASENTDFLGLFMQDLTRREGQTADLFISFGQLE